MRVTCVPFAFALASGLLWGDTVDAQIPGPGPAVLLAPRTHVAVTVGGYRRPLYDPFFSPFYFDTFYGPYYRPFYRYAQGAYGPVVYKSSASLRVQVSPRETEVYIDNYYAGTVDDFDGFFQRLRIEPGAHDITLYLDGYRTVRQQIYLQPTGTFRLRYTMQPLSAGETAETRPTQPPRPTGPQPGSPTLQGGPDASPRLPPPAPPPQEGSTSSGAIRSSASALSIRIQPEGAELLVDGERWEGPSDDARLIIHVTPGRHHIEVRSDGYRSYQTDIDVRPGDTSTLNISLTRQ